MNNYEKVNEYLEKAKIFYVSTVNGDKPKCRPFSFKIMYEGKLYFGVGTFKDCYKQLMENPNIEIVASDGQGFLRYYGKAKFVENEDLFKKSCEEAPYIPKMYNDETGHKLGMFYLEDATAEFRSLMGIEEEVKFDFHAADKLL